MIEDWDNDGQNFDSGDEPIEALFSGKSPVLLIEKSFPMVYNVYVWSRMFKITFFRTISKLSI